MPRHHLTRWQAAVAAFIAVAAVFTVTIGTVSAAGHAQQSCSINNPCIHGGGTGDVDHGTTAGWLSGKTVDFQYSKNFYCAAPPASGAPSFCEAGANANFAPVSGQIDPLYVVTPVGFTPATSTLQCPTTGLCINHPHNIDLSRIFGSATSNALLPPHSHVVTTSNKGVAEWWRIFVVGVTNQTAWDGIVNGKSFAAVSACQASAACTASIPSNLFLFFAVRPEDAGADTPNR
jgi:hypothetical protein